MLPTARFPANNPHKHSLPRFGLNRFLARSDRPRATRRQLQREPKRRHPEVTIPRLTERPDLDAMPGKFEGRKGPAWRQPLRVSVSSLNPAYAEATDLPSTTSSGGKADLAFSQNDSANNQRHLVGLSQKGGRACRARVPIQIAFEFGILPREVFSAASMGSIFDGSHCATSSYRRSRGASP